jgi:hypothetical protein
MISGQTLRVLSRGKTGFHFSGSSPQLGGADPAQELGHLAAQLPALRFQRLGGEFHVLGRRRGGIGVGFDAGDVIGDVLGALRGVLGAAGDLLGGGASARHQFLAWNLTAPVSVDEDYFRLLKWGEFQMLISALVTFLVVILILYLINLLPLDGRAKQIARVIVIILGVVSLLKYIAVF